MERFHVPLCIRRGSAEHFWRHRPRPFRKELLSGSKIVGDRKGKDKVALLASDTSIREPESVNWIDNQVLVANNFPTTDNDAPGAGLKRMLSTLMRYGCAMCIHFLIPVLAQPVS